MDLDYTEILNSKESKKLIKRALENPDSVDSSDLELLGDILKAANYVYSNTGDDTHLTDSEYDSLISLYESLSDSSLPTGAPVSGDKVSAKYLTLRGTLAKIYKLTDEDITSNDSQKSIYDWITKIKNLYREKTGKELDTSKLEVHVGPKYDGVSIVCEYTKDGKLIRALTRGDTENNESKDVTGVIKYVEPIGPFTNAESEYAIKCEAMILDKDLDEVHNLLHKDYKNTRALASGIINTKDIDPDIAKYLHLIKLRYSYFKDGKESPQYMCSDMYNVYKNFQFTESSYADIRQWAIMHKTVLPGFRCDGAVISILDEDVREVLGRTGDKQNYEVAYKFTMEYATSTVKDVIFQVGNLGSVTPVVEFKKVKLKGNDVKRAAISYSDFLKYKLAPGDEIKVIYDIVPYVTLEDGLKRSGKKKIKAPKVCPECGAELEVSDTGKKLFCPNKKCVCRLKGKILNYVTKVGIENISYETIDDLYDAGFLKTIEDLYTLEDHAKKISQIDGYGAVSLSRIFKSIEDNKMMSQAKFLGSLGIEGASIKTFHDILQHVSYDDLIEFGLNKDENALVGIHGIKEKLSSKVINGIYENRKLIDRLEEYLILTDEPKDTVGQFKVTFTKVRDEELEKWITDNGGIIDNDSVKKNTSLVIVPKIGVSSSKVKAAEKYGIPVVEISEAKKYITERLL